MSKDLSLALRLYTDSARFVAGLTQAESGTRRFVGGAKREFEALKGAMGGVQGKLAQLGVGVGGVAALVKSAGLDKEMQYMKNTTGATRKEIAGLRDELFDLQVRTGQSVDTLRSGVDALIAGGSSLKQARATIGPMAETMATAKASAEDLAKAMGVVSQRFDIDLTNVNEARLVLDKMKVAGEEGYAELSNLPALFSTVGGSAKTAGLNLDQTLAFIETLSLVQPNTDRLATLAESTLRVFTIKDYRDKAEKAMGIRFTDKSGMNRDPITVLREMQDKFKRLTTDAQRSSALDMAFGGSDKDTIEGLRSLLTGTLDKYAPIAAKIQNASGSSAKDIKESISGAAVAAERLKGALGKAAYGFAEPINDAFGKIVNWGLDEKKNGGLGLDGKDMMLGGGALALGTFAAARYGGKAISGLAKRFGGTAAGVAEGKALEAAAGVTPVFVVNWPASIGGSVADIAGTAVGSSAAGKVAKVASRAKTLAILAGGLDLAAWGSMGAAGAATATAGVTAAGLAGYGVGSGLNWGAERLARGTRMEGFGTDVIGGSIVKILALLGNADARESIAMNKRADELLGKINIQVNDGRVTSVTASTNLPRLPMNVDAGRSMINP